MAKQPDNQFSLIALMSEYNFMKNRENNRQILQTVLCCSDKIVNMTLEEAASFCNVSVSTFLRFCKDLQFDSYSDFKTTLRHETQSYYSKYSPHISTETPAEEVFDLLVDAAIENLKEFRKALDIATCKRLAQYMTEADKVFFFDIRYSQSRIRLESELAMHGKRVYFSADYADQLDYTKEITKNSIVVINRHDTTRDEYLRQLVPQIRPIGARLAFVQPFMEHSDRFLEDVILYYGQEGYSGIPLLASNELVYEFLTILVNEIYTRRSSRL